MPGKGPRVEAQPASGVDVATLNDDFPVAFSRFAPLLVGTPDEIWTKMVRQRHGEEKHSERQWYLLIERYRFEG